MVGMNRDVMLRNLLVYYRCLGLGCGNSYSLFGADVIKSKTCFQSAFLLFLALFVVPKFCIVDD